MSGVVALKSISGNVTRNSTRVRFASSVGNLKNSNVSEPIFDVLVIVS